MNEKFDENPGPLGKKADQEPRDSIPVEARPIAAARNIQANGHAPSPKPFDFWVAADLLAHRWGWLFLGGLIFAAGFSYLGWRHITPKYTATANLLRFESPATPEFFKT